MSNNLETDFFESVTQWWRERNLLSSLCWIEQGGKEKNHLIYNFIACKFKCSKGQAIQSIIISGISDNEREKTKIQHLTERNELYIQLLKQMCLFSIVNCLPSVFVEWSFSIKPAAKFKVTIFKMEFPMIKTLIYGLCSSCFSVMGKCRQIGIKVILNSLGEQYFLKEGRYKYFENTKRNLKSSTQFLCCISSSFITKITEISSILRLSIWSSQELWWASYQWSSYSYF